MVLYKAKTKTDTNRSEDPSAVNPETKCEHCVSSWIDLAARLSLSIADNEDEELILTMGEENNSAVPILVNHHQGNSRRLLE